MGYDIDFDSEMPEHGTRIAVGLNRKSTSGNGESEAWVGVWDWNCSGGPTDEIYTRAMLKEADMIRLYNCLKDCLGDKV